MLHTRRTLASTAIALSLACFSIGSAFAQDANAVAQRLKDVLAYQGVELSWANVSANGSQIVLDGVNYGVPGTPDKISVGTVTLEDVTEVSGGYKIGSMSLPVITFKDQGIEFKMTSANMSGVTLPAPGTDYMSNLMLYDSAKVESITFAYADKQVFSVENIHVNLTAPNAGAMSFKGGAEKFSADLSALPDPRSRATLQALGYQQATGNIQMEGSWNPADGRVDLSRYELAIDNAGKLGITVDFEGYTPEFLNTVQTLSKKLGEGGSPEEQRSDAIQMANLFQALILNGASVRFEDASLTNKVLNFVAQQQGADPAQLKEQTKTIIPFLLASSPIKDEAFKKNVSDAVAAFLDNPKSLTVRAKPATPQPFALLGAVGQADPGSLPTALGLSVTAND
ncbi:MAG: hypothetical protein KF874_06420 [Rhizobiaceae bacterium]|nr:hypothetical protein [Rhizobiaceae bacterium]